MSALPIPDLARQYVNWLHDQILTIERGTAHLLSTPFLDSSNDGIESHLDGAV